MVWPTFWVCFLYHSSNAFIGVISFQMIEKYMQGEVFPNPTLQRSPFVSFHSYYFFQVLSTLNRKVRYIHIYFMHIYVYVHYTFYTHTHTHTIFFAAPWHMEFLGQGSDLSHRVVTYATAAFTLGWGSNLHPRIPEMLLIPSHHNRNAYIYI